MTSPYDHLPERAFWRRACAERAAFEIGDVYAPKFALTKSMPVATQGSCFAQHLGRQFVQRGYRWFEAEPTPFRFTAAVNAAYNYGIFSFRTGNIYTPRLLLQWLRWARGEAEVPDLAWRGKNGWIDPFRPAIEPDGFETREEMESARARLIRRMAAALPQLDVFVFTFGLTEGWEDTASGTVYPMCPGTVAGEFDGEKTRFVNYGFRHCLADMEAAIAILRHFNPQMKVLLTVSPVPLVATASGKHVLDANGRSKSILRAVAATLAEADADVDYFPSYELITQPPFGNTFFAPNLRSVTGEGVAFVMGQVFAAHGDTHHGVHRAPSDRAPREEGSPATAEAASRPEAAHAPMDEAEDLVCEEVLLDAAATSPRTNA